MSFFNLSMGVMGRALHPVVDLLPGGKNDAIYPFMVSELAPEFLKGIVVAGILAAALSTFDSIGSTLSALFTRDIYARFIVRDGDDNHYLKVGRWATPLVIGGAFLYIFPYDFLGEGMVSFFISISSVFVVPLLTLYLMGRFTPVHRRSGVVGLCVGGAYGLARLWIDSQHVYLGFFLTNKYAAYSYSMLITAAAMVAVSLALGWEKKGELRTVEEDGWLGRSQAEARALQEQTGKMEAESISARAPGSLLPAVLALLVLALGCILSFVIFW
jgi:SSS family solute:Na+ symporter